MDLKGSIYIYIHTHTMEYYSVIKRNEILPFFNNRMDLEDIISSEISQRKTNMIDIMCMISLVCVIQKIKQTSEYNKKEADSQIQRTN